MFSKFVLAWLFLISAQLVDSRGGGRGSSGARSSSSSFSSSRSSSTSRSGGYTSSSSSYRTSAHATNLRQNVFHTTTTTTMFSYSPIYHSNIILVPSTPFIYGGYHYYWGGHYSYAAERPQQCDYTVTSEDEEFSNVTYSNGTKISQISFGCRVDQHCCDLECCNNSSGLFSIIFGVLAVLGLFLFCVCLSKYSQCTTIDNSVPDVTHTTVITRTFTTQQQSYPPPPPPGWEPSPPGYMGAPPQPTRASNIRPMSSSHVQPHMMKY